MSNPAYEQWEVTEAAYAAAAALETSDFPEARELLLSWQQSRCALCGRWDRALVVDHDHQTAEVRGLLCQRCNGVEGRESRWTPSPAIEQYRTWPPAAVLGMRVIYHDLFGPVFPEPALLDPNAEETHDAIQAMFAQLAAARNKNHDD
jgi:hypothetical protein